MPYTTQTSDFWGWYQRHNNRVVWKHFFDAGMDLFAVGPSNNPQSFLDLTNIMPGMNGGLGVRWPLVFATLTTAPSSRPLNQPLVRHLVYNYPQDASDPSNTANTNAIFSTDGQYFYGWTDSWAPFTGYGPTGFASYTGQEWFTTSRGWVYYGDGVNTPRKVNPSYTTKNTDSLVGIDLPRYPTGTYALNYSTSDTFNQYPSVLYQRTGGPALGVGGYYFSFAVGWYPAGSLGYNICGPSTGYGYTSIPTVTVTDTAGTGSGCTVVVNQLGPNGEINAVTVTNPGSGYGQAVATVSAPPTGGVQAYLVLYTQTNTSAPLSGKVVGADPGGPMSFVSGRRYAVALQNSITGHTSDVYLIDLPTTQPSGLALNLLTSSYTATELNAGTSIPVYTASPGGDQGVTAGYTQIPVLISVPTASLDPQVDTVVLLATSDGGGVGTLYQVTTLPLSDFTAVTGYLQYHYVDKTPDSYNDQNTTGNTLLEADLWAFTDSAGDTFGILLNTPPTPTGFLYPEQHQGRLFATDGKTIFYSKSLEEVTTSTGLITAKWEECWPGDYQLPVASNNETLLGLRSDGTNLHIGTDKSMFTLYGSGPSDFSIPSQAFAETGILSNDTWTVIYAEGQPSGFVWLTQDNKVIHSDFATYREIGTAVSPILATIDPAQIAKNKVLSLTQGPYNLVFLQLYTTTQVAPIFLVWDTRLQKWYRWTLPSQESGTGWTSSSAFIYQYPGYTGSSFAPGSKFLFFENFRNSGGSLNFSINYFNPMAGATDFNFFNIPWNIRTSWQDCGDSTAIKVVNEIELTSDYAAGTYGVQVSLFGATSQAQFSSGGVLLKQGIATGAPLAALGVYKLYCAGTPTAAKYYSLQFTNSYSGLTTGSSANPAYALSSCSLENFPMARI